MSRALLIRAAAETDLAEAKAWYERQRPALGEQFIAAVQNALERIERLPESAPIVHSQTRRMRVRRFPYGIFYRVTSRHISILAVYHTSRDPRGWQSRSQ